jgi:hypothetical protein
VTDHDIPRSPRDLASTDDEERTPDARSSSRPRPKLTAPEVMLLRLIAGAPGATAEALTATPDDRG